MCMVLYSVDAITCHVYLATSKGHILNVLQSSVGD